MEEVALDGTALLSAARKRVETALATIPQQLETPSESLMCVIMSSMDGDDHLEFNFDRSIFRQLRVLKDQLAFNVSELTSLLIVCSKSVANNWSISTLEKVNSVVTDKRITEILSSCTSALVCTLSEPVAAAAWARPAVKLAVVSSFLFPVLELDYTHRSIFGVYVQADQRRCDSLCMCIVDNPPHTILKTQIADALVSVLSSLR